jgi:tRNA 2-selenouridine synthase
VLGELPDAPQPSQKMFETRIWDFLRRANRRHPIFVESESKKIGQLQVPDILLQHMRAAECIRIDAPISVRTEFLLREYAHFVRNPAKLRDRVDCLRGLHANEAISRWHELIAQGRWPAFVTELLEHHYDPAYRRSMARNFRRLSEARILTADQLDAASVQRLSEQVAAIAQSLQAGQHPQMPDHATPKRG